MNQNNWNWIIEHAQTSFSWIVVVRKLLAHCLYFDGTSKSARSNEIWKELEYALQTWWMPVFQALFCRGVSVLILKVAGLPAITCILNLINAKSKNEYIFWECQFQINHQSSTQFLLVLGTNIYNDDNFILSANLVFCFGVIHVVKMLYW